MRQSVEYVITLLCRVSCGAPRGSRWAACRGGAAGYVIFVAVSGLECRVCHIRCFIRRATGRPAASLTGDQFRAEFPAEGLHIEFKQGAPRSAIAETAAAFSNTDGGVILLGVSDDGTVHGLQLGVKGETRIRNTLSQVRDLGFYRVHRLEVDGKSVVAVAVSRHCEGFAQLGSGQVKERRGASNATLMGVSLADFISRRFTRSAEIAPTRTGIEDIDPDSALQLARAWRWPESESDPTGPALGTAGRPAHTLWKNGDSRSGLLNRLRGAGFIVNPVDVDGEDRLSLTGALYLLSDPGRALGKAYVEVFRYQHEGIDYDRREEFRGPLQNQVTAAVDFVLGELGFDWAMRPVAEAGFLPWRGVGVAGFLPCYQRRHAVEPGFRSCSSVLAVLGVVVWNDVRDWG